MEGCRFKTQFGWLRFWALTSLMSQVFIQALLAQENSVGESTRREPLPAWELCPVETRASLRGLYVLDENTMWASGNEGTVVVTTDQGKTFRVLSVPGSESLDIRDLQLLDSSTIVAMTAGTPTRILRSEDQGNQWSTVFESADPNVFLDSIAFWNEKEGLAMGDPIDERLYLLGTSDGGKTWNRVANTPKVAKGEAGFAASGTNMVVCNQRVLIGLGGGEKQLAVANSRVLISDRALEKWTLSVTPISRHESAGIFSLAMVDDLNGVAVGGDYLQPDSITGNIALTRDGGLNWKIPRANPPSGYRSGVAVWKPEGAGACLISVGPNGTDLSSDLGETWVRVSNEGFHAVQFSRDGRVGWAVGSEGRIARWAGRLFEPANSNAR
jgi:photosystem II stability/assembly factor-like uncharacterized protein